VTVFISEVVCKL